MSIISKEKSDSLLGKEWSDLLYEEINKPYMQYVVETIKEERSKYNVFPESSKVFRAYRETPPDNIKVVIIGQDPYHRKGQANGLAFSVDEGISYPPSLQNILEEMRSDIGEVILPGSDFTYLAHQGVFLLNTSLTVREGLAGSHSNIGWKMFTGKTIQIISDMFKPVFFILWGNHARQMVARYITDNTLIGKLYSAHPSPLSARRGFFGSKPFTRANIFLEEAGLTPIKWA